MVSSEFINRFNQVARSPDPDLATAALLIARLEYPKLNASHYLKQLDQIGEAALHRLREQQTLEAADPLETIKTLNSYLFKEQGFAGNKHKYDDPRDSFLNEVMDRRIGIPITLALVYIEIARRAGVYFEGVNFPGHFLLRMKSPSGKEERINTDIIIDPFHGGAVLSEMDCQRLLREHVGDEVAFNERLLAKATKQQILIRLLVNLKRIYIKMRSFPQGLAITELLLALNPSSMTELRDRGLLAYHLNDFSSALRDLEMYLRLASRKNIKEKDQQDEHKEIWEYIKVLHRRLASCN